MGLFKEFYLNESDGPVHRRRLSGKHNKYKPSSELEEKKNKANKLNLKYSLKASVWHDDEGFVYTYENKEFKKTSEKHPKEYFSHFS